jgi:preprotein translocase subunit SecA
MQDLVMEEAEAYYQRREEELSPDLMREIERRVMLQIIDQRWREHLQEMDYLQEGINLRAMGQRDPLVEWQREGYEMFGELMHGVAQDFVRSVMHVEVLPPEETEAMLLGVQTHSAEDDGTTGLEAAAQQAMAEQATELDGGEEEGAAGRVAVATSTPMEQPTKQQTVRNDEWAKTGRNEPCPCGSGKKYKLCHGR